MHALNINDRSDSFLLLGQWTSLCSCVAVEGLVSQCFAVMGVSGPRWKTSLPSMPSKGGSFLAVPENQMQNLASHYYAGRFISITATRGFTFLWHGDRQPLFSSQEEGKNSLNVGAAAGWLGDMLILF